MRESAFVDPPWLLDREGAGYVQVTELLYRVAEQCDGQSTLDEIAQKVSDTTGRAVSTDNVRTLIAKQLMPRGIVAGPGGQATAPVAAGGRSVLALSMKVALEKPELIRTVTRPFSILFWPPVLIGVLIAAGLVEVWLYLIHGVGSSVRDALYAPGLMLAALGVTVLAAGFHEFGHAAALSYGGGTVRGMGAGVYIVYPAFYTDVSDNYRLPRWARVRTDLGGFYFNLIFALAIMALYAVTGQELLLLIVVMINLEIIHQLMPLGRLDGYWTLADVTGVPDFVSQMGAFVRSTLKIPGWEGRKLPELKWWAKAVFSVYMLVAIPLLLFLLFLMIKNTPQILATAWDSFRQQLGALSEARDQGSFLGMAGAIVQMFALALPTLGLMYTLYTLARRLIVAVWNWSTPTPTRRVIGGLGSAAAVGALAYLWAPELPFRPGQSGPAYAYTRANFVPIQPGVRGTLFEAVGASPPAWVAALDQPGRGDPSPTPESTPDATPAASPGTTGTPAVGAGAAPTSGPAASPAVVVTAVPAGGATPVPSPVATSQPTSVSATPVLPATPGASPGVLTQPATPAATASVPTAGPTLAPINAPTSTPARPAPTLAAPGGAPSSTFAPSSVPAVATSGAAASTPAPVSARTPTPVP